MSSCKSYSHFYSKNISVLSIFNDQNFNDTLTNDIISFEQLGLMFASVLVYSYMGDNSVKLVLYPFWKGVSSKTKKKKKKCTFINPQILIFFLFLHENVYCGYQLEVPLWGTSNEYLQHISLRNKKKKIMWITLMYSISTDLHTRLT